MIRVAAAALALVLAAAPAAAQGDARPAPRVLLADSLELALNQARAALAAGRAPQAVDEYRRAQGFLGLEMLYGQSRDPDAAGAEIARGLAEAYLALGDPYAAAVEAARGTELADDDARLWTLLGLARHRLADIAGARRALERALALDSREPDAHWGLGLVEISANRPREAAAHAERALALEADPRYALSAARWAEVAGDYSRAARALDRWLALRPRDPEAAGYRSLKAFYELLARGPVAAVDARVTRVQLGFDLKAGDEIPFVPVGFNGGAPVYVLFDTGAERNVLDRDFAEEIGVEPITPGGRLHGLYRSSPAGYVIVGSLALGSITVSRVPFVVGDFGALALRGQDTYYIAGVINPALLFHDFLVVFDYGHRRIELVRRGEGGDGYLARPSTRPLTKAPFLLDANGAWPVVLARLDGSRELPLLVDTGASTLFIGRSAAAALRIDPLGFAVSVGDRRRNGLGGLLLDGFQLDPWGIDLQGVLGTPFFRGSRVTFDYRDMVMMIEN